MVDAFVWAQDARPEPYPVPPRDPRLLWVNDRYLTVQTEGGRAGQVSYFLRLARCNLRCSGCDTQYDPFEPARTEDVVRDAVASGAEWVVVTGGEPGLHDLTLLCSKLHASGLHVAVETNGTRRLQFGGVEGFDWITVSPKTRTVVQPTASEVKVLVTPELTDDEIEELYGSGALAYGLRYVQPVWGDAASARRAVEFVKARPWWRLSVQAHKYLGIP